jgi:hypothetical protein
MAAPNVVNVSTITAKTALYNVTTSLANVITTSSNTVTKLNDVIITNYVAANVTSNVVITRGGINYYLGSTIVIPSQSTLVLIGKDSALYLEEGDYLQASTSTNSSIHLIASYEIIS